MNTLDIIEIYKRLTKHSQWVPVTWKQKYNWQDSPQLVPLTPLRQIDDLQNTPNEYPWHNGNKQTNNKTLPMSTRDIMDTNRRLTRYQQWVPLTPLRQIAINKTFPMSTHAIMKTKKTINKTIDKTLPNIQALCTGHTFTDHLAGSTTDQIPRMTPEMTISVVRYGCKTQVLLRRITDTMRKYKD